MWTCKEGREKELEHVRTINRKSPYGAATIAYMDAWGDMMEAIIVAEGIAALTPERVEQTSHDADTDGITGFMHSWSMSVLQSLWVYGDLVAPSQPSADQPPTGSAHDHATDKFDELDRIRSLLANRFGLNESEIDCIDGALYFEQDDGDGLSLSVKPGGMLELTHGAFCLRVNVVGNVGEAVDRAMAALAAFNNC